MRCVSVAQAHGIHLRVGEQASPEYHGIAREPSHCKDLISFLKAHPDCRLHREIRYPQWWMLLVAILAIHRFAQG